MARRSEIVHGLRNLWRCLGLMHARFVEGVWARRSPRKISPRVCVIPHGKAVRIDVRMSDSSLTFWDSPQDFSAQEPPPKASRSALMFLVTTPRESGSGTVVALDKLQMTSLLRRFVAAGLLFASLLTSFSVAAEDSKVRVLMLGDSGFHKPSEFYRHVAESLVNTRLSFGTPKTWEISTQKIWRSTTV